MVGCFICRQQTLVSVNINLKVLIRLPQVLGLEKSVWGLLQWT